MLSVIQFHSRKTSSTQLRKNMVGNAYSISMEDQKYFTSIEYTNQQVTRNSFFGGLCSIMKLILNALNNTISRLCEVAYVIISTSIFLKFIKNCVN